MKALQKTSELFECWNSNNILYCHWKSNEHLLEGLTGETDLDILCAASDKNRAEILLSEHDYIKCISQFGSRYPNVDDWVACDEMTGKLIHIHLHYDMITGHQGMKEYSLPWNSQALSTRQYNDEYGVYTIDPSLELVILFSRIGLKATSSKIRSAKKGKYKLADSDLREIEYLKERVDQAAVEEIVRSSFDHPEEMMFLLQENNFNSSWFMRLAEYTRQELRKYSRVKAEAEPFKRLFFYITVRYRFFFNKFFYKKYYTRKTLGENKGVVVAFLGQDGSGKSTVTEEVAKWLSWKLDARKYYLGSGDHYKSVFKTLFFRINNTSGILGLIKKISGILNLKKLSFRVRKLAKNAKSYSEGGGIAVFDRYPQVAFPGINDGPKIRDSLNGKKLPGWLNAILLRFADKEEKNYLKAVSVKPDLVIKLMLAPEVSVQRKPEESIEDVRKKHEIIKSLEFPESEVLIIDATMDYEEELVLIHNAIWNLILKAGRK